MKLKSITAFMICATILVPFCNAQDTITQKQQTQNRVAQDRGANRAGYLDERTMGSMIRASQLMGVNIENDAGESVGEVNDIVLDARTGRIGYVAVTYGGFLGIGNDLHAVPFQAMKFKQDPDDVDASILVLNVTKEQMEGAVGFEESTWPNFADKTFTDELQKRYGVERTFTRGDRPNRSSNRDRNQERDDNDSGNE